jgi:hypothetical protein
MHKCANIINKIYSSPCVPVNLKKPIKCGSWQLVYSNLDRPRSLRPLRMRIGNVMYEGCSKRFASRYFSQSLTTTEKCSFEGLKSDVSPARIPCFESFRQIAEL